jgi:phage-related protein
MLCPIHWVGSSLDDIRGMPEEARRDIGIELTLV